MLQHKEEEREEEDTHPTSAEEDFSSNYGRAKERED